MKIFRDFQQATPEWFAARKGIPTASRFDKIITAVRGEPSKQADDLINELIGEMHDQFLPPSAENFTNHAMRWGNHCEEDARKWYIMEAEEEVEQVGFCLSDDGRFGMSPDGLVGVPGILELKCPQAKTQTRYLRDYNRTGQMPTEYWPQVHGELIVGRPHRKWVDFLSYCPGLPPLLVRVEPDEYTAKLEVALEDFWTKFQAALSEIREMA